MHHEAGRDLQPALDRPRTVQRPYSDRGVPQPTPLPVPDDLLSRHHDCAAWATARAGAGLDEVFYLPLGHWPHHEMPGLFNTLIEDWAAQLANVAAATD